MDNKTDWPKSDETARKKHPYTGENRENEDVTDLEEAVGPDLQTSNKSGKHSSVEKLAASRPEFGAGRGAQPVSGAFGDDPSHVVTGRNAGPGTNQFRCNSCGRYFNSQAELSEHEPECRTAKVSTATGREELKEEDSRPHQPNDAESKEHPFQHGTKQT